MCRHGTKSVCSGRRDKKRLGSYDDEEKGSEGGKKREADPEAEREIL